MRVNIKSPSGWHGVPSLPLPILQAPAALNYFPSRHPPGYLCLPALAPCPPAPHAPRLACFPGLLRNHLFRKVFHDPAPASLSVIHRPTLLASCLFLWT